MPISPINKQKRDDYVRERFKHHKTKNPKWRFIFLIEAVASEVFLSTTTVTKILKDNNENVPCENTITKQTRQLQLSLP